MLLAAPALGYLETHLDEVADPLLSALLARRGEIDALPAPTKAEKAERRTIQPIVARLSKTARKRADDFSELVAGTQGVRKLGTAGDAYADEVAEGFVRAGIALTEREELLRDHRELLVVPKDVSKLDSALQKSADLRGAAAAETRPDRRAKLLAQAEATLATALRKAEKAVRRAGKPLPPTRFRSGDEMGPSGGRVAIPRDAASPLAGSSVVFAPNALTSLTVVTLGPGDAIVTGRDTPAGPSLRVSPEGLALSGEAEVRLPYALPDGAVAADLSVFRRAGSATTQLLGAEALPDGFAAATSLALGTFQAGIAAPPLGAPDGVYRVQMLAHVTNPGTTSTNPAFDPGVSAAFFVQDYTFRRNGSGSAALGSLQVMTRAYTRTAPHHVDQHSSTITGAFEFAWTASAGNRFSFQFPAGPTATATAQGVASTDGRVLVFAGRTTGFDFFAVGLRAAPASSPADAADLAGRWVAVEAGLSFEDGGAEPFSAIWSDRFRTFTADDAGDLTYDAAGAVFSTEMAYATDQATPAHSRTSSSAADGGTESLSVFADGTLQDTALVRRGQFDPVKGVLALRRFDASGDGGKRRELSLMVAVRQPSPAAETFEGAWNVLATETAFTTGLPSSGTSSHATGSALGTFAVDANLDAAVAFSPGVLGTHTLQGSAPITSISWTLTSTTSAVYAPAIAGAFAISADAAGNHAPDPSVAGNTWWFGRSGDGAVLLGARTTAPGPGGEQQRGILIGLE